MTSVALASGRLRGAIFPAVATHLLPAVAVAPGDPQLFARTPAALYATKVAGRDLVDAASSKHSHSAAMQREADMRTGVTGSSSRCIAVGGQAARGCDPNRPIGRGATRLQVSGTAPTSRAPLTGLRRIADVHQARQRGVGSGGTWMTAVRVGELTLSTRCSRSRLRTAYPKPDTQLPDLRAIASAAQAKPAFQTLDLSCREH
jgi:hypothetical protein